MTPPRLPRIVFLVGAVSFCTDLASEMIVPLLPILFASLGSGMTSLGLMQGSSELVLAGLKVWSGRRSDQGARKPWIVFGYTLSSLTRPLFALVALPWQAVVVRSLDRVGKGLRSAPRDALLTDAVAKDQRGAAFGVQRALDHAGALGGALVAASLVVLGVPMRTVFALALLPGLVAVLLLVLAVREPERGAAPGAVAQDPPDARARLRPFLAVVALSAAAYGVDLFALTRARELGAPDASLPLWWAALHVVRSSLSAPLGALSDRVGRRALLWLGLLVQGALLAGFAAITSLPLVLALLCLLGVGTACHEAAERGFVADLTGAHKRGSAFGLYHAVQGLGAFAGALAIGVVWDRFGAPGGFAVAAACAGCALLALLAVPKRSRA